MRTLFSNWSSLSGVGLFSLVVACGDTGGTSDVNCPGCTGGTAATGGALGSGGDVASSGSTTGSGATFSGGASATGGLGGIPASGGELGTGGASTGGVATGGASTGGASTGGASTGGAATGGASTGGASTGGASTGGASTGGAGTGGSTSAACSAPDVRITEIDLGATISVNEDEVALKPLAISPKPSGGSRLAYMGTDGNVHVAELDASDHLVGTPISIPAHDFADIYADDTGVVVLMTRDAQGGGTLNCGQPTNLCGSPPSPPIACYDMYMVRYEGSTEKWATKLTNSSASLPPYSTSKTGPEVFMIWWYAHHGRIASDGTNFAGYFGAAISVSQDGCINIHQGDRMKVVGPSGTLLSGNNSFDWGCSHSGYERLIWDDSANKYVAVCKTDNNNRIAFAPNITTIKPVDLAYSNLSDLALGASSGYYALTSDLRSGEPALSDGLAEVHLLHFTNGAPDQDVVIAGAAGLNARAPHLAAYGTKNLLATWETSSAKGDLSPGDANRKMYFQVRSATTGAAISTATQVAVKGNRYQALRSFPDGSVAYPAPGTTTSKVKILRVLPCAE